ncbi:MurR/RpiR family transcriptional regulator [uncultured Lactobacillus sp.]|uniref:MurR/RpiR family transcriptional regulator n=1 Tax=uncultured Lactobacillus sp. TaxID=153152 RepID=UPI002616EF2E|nr:MurR/RpiR family transcriptional regulator [uncultured Lactobacillus sp.]
MAFFGFKDLSSLSSVDMTLYRYITENTEKVIYMRVRDIAKNTHVSNSSVMRFVHKMGFNSFPEFKAFINNKYRGSDELDEFEFITKENFSPDIKNQIKIVADQLFQCDNIIFLGMGSSSFIAGYTARQLASLGYNTSLVTDPFYPLHERLRNTTNNALICFSVSGETTELIELLNSFVNDEDTTIISITGSPTSTIARMSRFALTYHEKEYRLHRYYDLSSQIPAMYIIEGIIRVLRNQSEN